MLDGYATHDHRKKVGQEKKACIEVPLLPQVTARRFRGTTTFSASRQSAIAEGMC